MSQLAKKGSVSPWAAIIEERTEGLGLRSHIKRKKTQERGGISNDGWRDWERQKEKPRREKRAAGIFESEAESCDDEGRKEPKKRRRESWRLIKGKERKLRELSREQGEEGRVNQRTKTRQREKVRGWFLVAVVD